MATTTDLTLSGEQDAEVLGHLMDAQGPKAVADLDAALADAEATASRIAASFGAERRAGKNFVTPLVEAVAQINAQVVLARTLRSRLGIVAGLGLEQAGAVVDGPFASAASARDETHLYLLDGAGQSYVNELRAAIKAGVADLKDRLSGSITDLGNLKGNVRKGINHGPYQSQHGANYQAVARVVAIRDDLKARLADLDGHDAKVPPIQAARVAAVVTAAGGPDKVAAGVAESRKATGGYWPDDPGHADVVAASRTVADLDAALARLDGPGQLADALAADRKAATKALDAAKSAVDGRLKGSIKTLVSSAIGGDEPARAAIETAARSQPRAFPSDFARAIMEAQFEWSADGSTALDVLAHIRPIGPRDSSGHHTAG